jgi:hypothetical protein
MTDIQEIALAVSAFVLASAVFRWSGSPKHGASSDRTAESAAVLVAQFMFKECHDFVMASTVALQDQYYESEMAVQKLSELDHAYPEPIIQSSTPLSNEDSHFSYAGSSCGATRAQYHELDHMFALNCKSGQVRQIQVQPSVARDHFSFAASACEEDIVNEFDHSRIPASVRKAKVVYRSTALGHFSYAASAFDERINVSEYDHSEIRARITRNDCRTHSTSSDHFSYAGSSFHEEYTNELDHSLFRQREARRFHPYSTSADHFSYCGSCPDVETNQYDHFHYTEPLAAH